MILDNAGCFPVRMMCRKAGVSSAGYYAWLNRKPSSRSEANAVLTEKIRLIYESERRRPGSIRVKERLHLQGEHVGRHRVARLMRLQGWRGKAAKRFKATTHSNHNMPVAPNLLRQDFRAKAINQKWMTDITYIWTDEGWLYLATVLDAYSRMLIGWSLSERMTTTLVKDALQTALWRRKMPQGVIVHSDRGSQYCASDYQAMLRSNGLICSMSKRGDCYDNALMESWNHSFKVEAVHGERFRTREEARLHIFEYIEVYYNRDRLHSKLGYLSPQAFEDKMCA